MKKPKIGITTGTNPEGSPDEAHRFYMSYWEAIAEAGGDPMFLDPRPASDKDVLQIVDGIDGLLLSGGRDVHPDRYPSQNEPGDEEMSVEELIAAYKMDCDPTRDDFEIPLIQTTYQSRKPILGICRGLQVLNVALGGSLIKDIRTGRKHWAVRKDEEGDGEAGTSRKHMVSVISKSRLAGILGDCPLLVNSRHHQGVGEREKSPKLTASAVSPDGIIEALEDPDHPWLIVVQWHPERKADEYVYDQCKPLFASFVEAAKTPDR